MKREVIVENKKTHKKEKAMIIVVNNILWFLSNNADFNGARISDKHTNNFTYSWVLARPEANLLKYKTFKEFEKIEKIDFDLLFSGRGKNYIFTFADESKKYFKRIIL